MKWPVSSTVRGRTGRWGLAARRQWIAADHGGAFSRDDPCRLDATIHAHGCDQGKKTRILSNASDGPVRGPASHGLFVLPYPRIALTWKDHLCVHLQSYHLRRDHPIHSEARKRCLFRWSRLVWMSYH